MNREMELLFQASRTSPMLHEAAVCVEADLRNLTTERDELVLQNERLGNDLVAAVAERDRLAAENADLIRRLDGMARAPYGEYAALKAERDRYRRALEQIAVHKLDTRQTRPPSAMRNIALAALDEGEAR